MFSKEGSMSRFGKTILSAAMLLSGISGCSYYGDKFPKKETASSSVDYTLRALWGAGVSTGSSDSYVRGLAIDSSGNVYAAGRQFGTSTYTYGTGVTAAGSHTAENISLVKYNSAGVAQWAKSTSSGAQISRYYGIGVDGAGNAYCAGVQNGGGITVDYGSSVTALGTAPANVLMVKYNTSGVPQWAKVTTSGTANALFYGVAADSAGNSYGVGQQDPGTVNYGNGISSTAVGTLANTLIVKYDSSGATQWARTVTTQNASARLVSAVVDSSGDIYAVGNTVGTGTNTYGAGVTAAGTSSGNNALIIKYSSSGTALWARSVTAGTNDADYVGIAIDAAGMIYASGWQVGTGTLTYGPGVTLSCSATGNNPFLVKYDSNGNAIWARCPTGGNSAGSFWSLTALPSGDIVGVGTLVGTGTITFASGVSATGSHSSLNPLLVRFSSSGTPLFARSNSLGTGDSRFFAAVSDSSNNVYAGGELTGTTSYNFGDGVSVTGSSAVTNSVLVKYGK